MTKIYKTYLEFTEREDKRENGVSIEHSEMHPEWEQANSSNAGCWNCSGCSRCSGCSGCSNVANLYDKKNLKGDPESDWNGAPPIPAIENIHAKVYEAVSQPKALDMGNWHTCESTHCRGGWVVTLAGEAGRKLEAFHGTLLAAQLIYRESGYPFNPCRFFDSNEDALADMKRLAEAKP